MDKILVNFSLCILVVLIQMQGSKSCLEKERTGLLELKASFNPKHDKDQLPSWVDEKEADCCSWQRVHCNQTTGHVMDLILDGVAINKSHDVLLNLSLFHPFEHLLRLDLSANLFSRWVEIEGLCGMKNLEELDISENGIKGSPPQCLGNLKNLRVLDLSSNFFRGTVPAFITSLKSLEYLSLFDNYFDGLFKFSSLANHSKLEVFLLSPIIDNLHVETESSPWLPSFQLKALQLQNCNLNSQHNSAIPSFLLYQHELRLIDLSHNKLQGEFPTWLLRNNSNLETLYLMNNSFAGTLQLLPYRHGLLKLQISNNRIRGKLPDKIGEIFSNLSYVNLSKNSFDGTLPRSMGEMQWVRALDLSHNNFSGELAEHFLHWTALVLLRLSHNHFSGPIIPKFANLTRLQSIFLDHNSFCGEIEDGVLNKSSLLSLDISNNRLSGRIPGWMGSFTNLEALLLSNNLLEGEIPYELCNLDSLEYLDLSENGLSGSLPSCFRNLSNLEFLHLQKNVFKGFEDDALFELSGLVSLDLSDNKFSGEIPYWISHITLLRVLRLGGNYLYGYIPHELCDLKHIKLMDLSHNRLTGPIPSCFDDVSFGQPCFSCVLQEGLPYQGSEGRTTHMPCYNCGVGQSAGSERGTDGTPYPVLVDVILFIPGRTILAYNKSTLRLNNNFLEDLYVIREPLQVDFRTKGNFLSYEGNILKLMIGLDLSSNRLSGMIPSQLGNLTNLTALNLSDNQLSGTIPSSLSNLIRLESLDLSFNNLNGEIPPDLTKVNTLGTFNVSYNDLSGPVPTAGQFGTFDENNYRGNPGLCGPFLNKSCSSTTPPPPSATECNEGTYIELVYFYWGFASSYVTVILGLATILWVSPRWCRSWFRFVDLCLYYCLPQYFRNRFH